MLAASWSFYAVGGVCRGTGFARTGVPLAGVAGARGTFGHYCAMDIWQLDSLATVLQLAVFGRSSLSRPSGFFYTRFIANHKSSEFLCDDRPGEKP